MVDPHGVHMGVGLGYRAYRRRTGPESPSTQPIIQDLGFG